MQLSSIKNSCGAGLLELIIYVALLAALIIGALDLMINASTVIAKARLQRTINTEGELAMQRIIREIRGAYDVDASNSSFDTHPGTLRLRTYAGASGSATTTADIRIISGLLHLTKATTSVDLITPNVSVSNLIFRNLNPTTTPKAVKIEMTLTGTSSRFTVTSPFYGTAILRGSY